MTQEQRMHDKTDQERLARKQAATPLMPQIPAKSFQSHPNLPKITSTLAPSSHQVQAQVSNGQAQSRQARIPSRRVSAPQTSAQRSRQETTQGKRARVASRPTQVLSPNTQATPTPTLALKESSKEASSHNHALLARQAKQGQRAVQGQQGQGVQEGQDQRAQQVQKTRQMKLPRQDQHGQGQGQGTKPRAQSLARASLEQGSVPSQSLYSSHMVISHDQVFKGGLRQGVSALPAQDIDYTVDSFLLQGQSGSLVKDSKSQQSQLGHHNGVANSNHESQLRSQGSRTRNSTKSRGGAAFPQGVRSVDTHENLSSNNRVKAQSNSQISQGSVHIAQEGLGQAELTNVSAAQHDRVEVNVPEQGHWLAQDAKAHKVASSMGLAQGVLQGHNTRQVGAKGRLHQVLGNLQHASAKQKAQGSSNQSFTGTKAKSNVQAEGESFLSQAHTQFEGDDAFSNDQGNMSPRAIRRLEKRKRRPHIPTGRRRFVHLSFWKICLIFVFALLLVGGGIVYRGYQQFNTIASFVVPEQEEPFELKEGATISRVVHTLADDAYHPRLLDLWVKLNHFNYPVIQKGSYLIDGQKTLSDLLADMREGNVIKVKLPTVALIEGMTANMVKNRLLANPELVQDPQLSSIFDNPAYFIERTLVKDSADKSLLEAIGGSHKSLEGLLMPATYEYIQDQYSTTFLLQQSLIKMANFMREKYIERNPMIDEVLTSPYEVLILASLVERESSLESERPLIAGVFINRLKSKIRLQTDPAVMYGVSPDFRGPLRLSQLKKDTPYNTYTRGGLPPTPIAMPSAESILAVLNPSETDYLFFVAKGPDPKLGHYFSSTLSEHNQAVKQYRAAVKQYKQQQLQIDKTKDAPEQTASSNETQESNNQNKDSAKVSLSQNKVNLQIGPRSAAQTKATTQLEFQLN